MAIISANRESTYALLALRLLGVQRKLKSDVLGMVLGKGVCRHAALYLDAKPR